MKVVTVEGWWSTNIGNSFFQIGSDVVMNKLGVQTTRIPDFPGYWNVNKGNPKNSLDFLNYFQSDLLILHGPIFRKEFDRINLKALKEYKARGGKIIILSAGMMDYSESKRAYYEKWLDELKIDLITTRDRQTFNFLKKKIKNVYDGIDIATYISDSIEPVKCKRDFVVYNFDQIKEPKFVLGDKGELSFDFEGKTISTKGFKRSEPLKYYKKLEPFIQSLFKQSLDNDFINQYEIIRTDHRFNPYFSPKIYKGTNSFANDTPSGYLHIYANSRLTLSNRVHACVATLAFGNHAMYFSNSKRAGLLDRLGLSEINLKPVKIDQSYLTEEQYKLETFIKNHL